MKKKLLSDQIIDLFWAFWSCFYINLASIYVSFSWFLFYIEKKLIFPKWILFYKNKINIKLFSSLKTTGAGLVFE